jgi:hypothetical protein
MPTSVAVGASMMLGSGTASVNVRRQCRIGCSNALGRLRRGYGAPREGRSTFTFGKRSTFVPLRRDRCACPTTRLPALTAKRCCRAGAPPVCAPFPFLKKREMCLSSRFHNHRFAFNEQTINQTAERAADQRTEPINVMVMPKIRCQSRPENARRIHRRAGERSAK